MLTKTALKMLWIASLPSLAAGQLPEDSLLAPAAAGPSARFGESVAVDGDTIVVGSSGAEMAVLFERSSGQWTRSQSLTGSDTASQDRFGSCVALAGDWLVIGAPRHRVVQSPGLAAEQTGAVYLFRRSSNGWVETEEWTGDDCGEGSYFGSSIDLEVQGNTARVLIGAPLHDGGAGFGSGGAYLFSNVSGTWSQEARLVAPDAAPLDQFGCDVALSADRAAVGAKADDDQGANSGSVYLFLPVTSASWGMSAKILPNLGGSGSKFGQSLDLDGERLAVGAPRADSLPVVAGSVHVFDLVNGNWIESAMIAGAGVQPGDQFGAGIALQGNRLLVGAYLQDLSNSLWDAGGAFVYEQNGGQWTESVRLTSTNSDAQSSLAYSTALDGGTIVLGAPGVDISVADSGAAYVYDGSGARSDFCSGDGGAIPGCTPCPCGNQASSGAVGGCLNGMLLSVRLERFGTPSLQLDGLHVRGTGLPPQSFALLLSGRLRLPSNPNHPCFGLDSGNSPPGMDGLRCVGGGVQRHGVRPADSSGEVSFGGGSTGLLSGHGFVPGETRQFQIFYRDNPGAGCGTGQNTSQGTSITLLP